jgi:archaeosine synthase beta-subunit
VPDSVVPETFGRRRTDPGDETLALAMRGPLPTGAAEATKWIRSLRSEKSELDPWKPQAFEVEDERSRSGSVDPTGTVFITNRECPFTCLMCDLWKYTTDESVPAGAVDAQVAAALEGMPSVRHVKLYNAGNFFDDRAIAPADRAAIAARVGHLDSVILENHPKMLDDRAVAFRDAAGVAVDVAMGLETVHPQILPRLNKRMTLTDFEVATKRLRAADLHVRAFILVRAPFMTEAEGVEWACRSLDFAFSVGVECCSVIPTRAGNGALDALASRGDFAQPSLASLEAVAEYGVALGLGRVFSDLWDVERIAHCPRCAQARITRLRRMNLDQIVPAPVTCDCR